ncbi:MAG: ABC transporter ATP-binding protein [Hyphomicrobiaceae bacterium]|nr:ABC transporter ATP-binding protein [Hyphomicrobiaceae bacterium]
MLKVCNVSKSYENGTEALSNVSFSVRPGEILAIVGSSGCGKSTLLRLISGLDQASRGSITLDNDAIAGPHPQVGLIFQEPRLLPWLRVADNVAFGLHALPAEYRRVRAQRALQLVGLAGLGSRWPRQLSGGQAQRVAIARALVTEPSVLLLDEPFAALDAFTRRDLQDHLQRIWADQPTILILVTHDLEEAIRLASRVFVMNSSPGTIGADLRVPLAYPRDSLSPAFEQEKRRLHAELAKRIDRMRVAAQSPAVDQTG